MVGVQEGVEAVRIVVEGGSEPIDVLVRADAMLNFVVDCHIQMPGADIYVEGELIDAAALVRQVIASRTAAAAAAAAAATPAAPAAPTVAPVARAPEVLSLAEAKSFTELMHASLAALAKLQLETFAACSQTAKQSLEEEMKRNKTFAADLAEQREQHRKALHEIGIFDRGAHVAIACDYAALRAGRAQRPESDGMKIGDVIQGFFPDTKRSAG